MLAKIYAAINARNYGIISDPFLKNKKYIYIYLSGSVDEYKYRHYFKKELGLTPEINILDPLSYSLKNYNEIVENDKSLIDRCDYVICYIKKYTAGTLMEFMYAYTKKKKILVISDDKRISEDYWIKYHTTTLFKSMDECITYLKQLTQGENK